MNEVQHYRPIEFRDEPPADLSRERALDRLTMMRRIRRFEEKCAELYSAEKIRGFLHLGIGEEAIASGAMPFVRADDDIVATYREHGHAIARGIPLTALMAEMYGKATGCCLGRGGSMHIFDRKRRLIGGNAIVGCGLPIAVGLALAARLEGSDRIAVCFFGEGAVAEGEFHESMNLAALWSLPVLFICENNYYAMGTALTRSESQLNLRVKAESYRVRAEISDGMNLLAVQDAVSEAVDFVRGEDKPYFLELETYRFRAHSMFDPELYRQKAEVEAWKHRCPISLFETALEKWKLVDENDFTKVRRVVEQEIDEAVEFAEASAWEPAEEVTRFVYSEAT
jgi:pyruvate dehydrogenase E1 component alpha subunit